MCGAPCARLMETVCAVVLDAMGVIYRACDDVAELLIPFARVRGCDLSDDEINRHYIRCSVGGCSSAELWRTLGVSGDAAALNQAYLRGLRLMPGVELFLEQMKRWQMPVACISNDVAEWSLALRRMHHLEDRIFSWTISGDVGTRKPDAAIFEHFRNETGCSFDRCVFIDDRARHLDAARRLGFRTLQFVSGGSPARGDHPSAGSFAEAAEWLDRLPHLEGNG